MTAPKLELREVGKSYDGKPVLVDVDLAVAPHEVVCLIGSSGSGKSTLLKCVNLLVDIDAGSILFDGTEISGGALNPNLVRQSMGIVFQAFNLFPHMSVIENVTLSPRKVHGLSREDAEDRARRLLDQFGLGDKVDAYPDRLSGGQQQRVAIA